MVDESDSGTGEAEASEGRVSVGSSAGASQIGSEGEGTRQGPSEKAIGKRKKVVGDLERVKTMPEIDRIYVKRNDETLGWVSLDVYDELGGERWYLVAWMDNCQSHVQWEKLRRVAPPQEPVIVRARPPPPPPPPQPAGSMSSTMVCGERGEEEQLSLHPLYEAGAGEQMDELTGRLNDGDDNASVAEVGGDANMQERPQDGKIVESGRVVERMWYCVVCLKYLKEVWQCEICKGCLCWPCYKKQKGSRKSVCGQCLTRPLITYREGERGPSAMEASEGGALVTVEEGAVEAYVDMEDKSEGTHGGRMTRAEVEAAKERIAVQTAAWERDHGGEMEHGGAVQPEAGTSDGDGDDEPMGVGDNEVAFGNLDVVD